VTYHGNNAGGSGTPPTDPSEGHAFGDQVTVLGNTGDLARTGYEFAGWSTNSDGSGIPLKGGDTFIMAEADVPLYARWVVPEIVSSSAGEQLLRSSTYIDIEFNVEMNDEGGFTIDQSDRTMRLNPSGSNQNIRSLWNIVLPETAIGFSSFPWDAALSAYDYFPTSPGHGVRYSIEDKLFAYEAPGDLYFSGDVWAVNQEPRGSHEVITTFIETSDESNTGEPPNSLLGGRVLNETPRILLYTNGFPSRDSVAIASDMIVLPEYFFDGQSFSTEWGSTGQIDYDVHANVSCPAPLTGSDCVQVNVDMDLYEDD